MWVTAVRARHIQLHHREGCVQLAIQEQTLQSVARVVDEDIDRNASLAEPLMQLDDRRNI